MTYKIAQSIPPFNQYGQFFQCMFWILNSTDTIVLSLSNCIYRNRETKRQKDDKRKNKHFFRPDFVVGIFAKSRDAYSKPVEAKYEHYNQIYESSIAK